MVNIASRGQERVKHIAVITTGGFSSLLLFLACEHLQLFQLNFPQYHKNEAQIISYTEVTYNVTFVWKIRTSNGDLSIFSDHRKLFVGSPRSFCKRRELFLLPPPLLSNVLHCAQPMCFM